MAEKLKLPRKEGQEANEGTTEVPTSMKLIIKLIEFT